MKKFTLKFQTAYSSGEQRFTTVAAARKFARDNGFKRFTIVAEA